MVDSSWDNSGAPAPQKQGMPTWAKVLLGCGIAFFLAMASCVGGIAYLSSSGGRAWAKGFARRKVGEALTRPWADLREAADKLPTEEGAKAFYAAHPGLVEAYPEQRDFLEAAKDWRPRIHPIPAEMPDPLARKGSRDLDVTMNRTPVSNTLTLRYRDPQGTSWRAEYKDDRLVGLSVH